MSWKHYNTETETLEISGYLPTELERFHAVVMNEDTWYVVRNTRGVTGFVGPGSKPVPLTDEEYERMLTMTGGDKLSFEVGDNVVVVSGVWENSTGVVQSISENRQIVTINIDMFGRETPVELDFVEVEKV